MSYQTRTFEGVQNDRRSTPLAETQTVTIDANLDNPEDVDGALLLTERLIEGTPSNQMSILELTPADQILELTNADKLVSQLNEKSIAALRAKFDKDRQVKASLSRSVIDSVKKVAAFGKGAGRMMVSGATDPAKLSLMVFRFVSASGSAYVGVSLETNLPLSVARYYQTLGTTFETGLMSASLVMFADAYRKVISHPGYFARHIDDSAWANEVVRRFRGSSQILRTGKITDVDAASAPLKVGRYTDIILRNLGLETLFVLVSTTATEGFWKAMINAPHAAGNAVEGSLGQTFFDASIELVTRGRRAAIEDAYPPGPVREAKLKRLYRMSDAAMAADSFVQVFMVMSAARGNALAKAALHFYFGAGALTRFVLLNRLENRLIVKEKADAAAAKAKAESAKPTTPSRPLRCEALLKSA